MKAIFKRFFWRVLLGAVFTAMAFAVMQPLAMLTGVPEVARVLPALAVLYWLDLSLLIGRVLLAPQIDAQKILTAAVEKEPGGAKFVSALLWLQIHIRLALLVWLIYVL
jgi:hypothetical protein